MTIQFKTDAVYTLGHNNVSLRLICTYIEDNTVWLKSETYPASDTTLLYKYDRKTKKLYVFNTKVQAYDLVENTLAELPLHGSTEAVFDYRKNGYLE